MQKLISKYALAAHLAILAVAPQFFSLGPVLCLAALAFCWLIFEPSRIGDESLLAARKRVISSIVADPVFWLSVLVLGFCVIRFFNSGIGMAFDAEAGTWLLSQPPFPYLPASASRCGSAELSAAVALMVVLQGCRNAMGRMARAAFMILFSAFTGLGALVNCVLLSSGVESVRIFAVTSFTNPQFLGVYYAMGLFCAVSGFSNVLHYRWCSSVILIIVAVVSNAAALFVFAPPAVILVFVSAILVFVLYTIVWHYIKGSHSQGLICFVSMGAFIAGAVALVMVALPEVVISKKLAPFFGEAAFLPENFKALHSQLSEVSLAVWKKCPWLGAGLGTFADSMKFVASSEFWKIVPPDQASPLSLHWKVLAERGAIGAFIIFSYLTLLLYTFFRRWGAAIKTFPQPSAMAGFFLFFPVALDSLYGVSMLSPGTMVAFFSILSISASSFSKVKNNG